ncbi:MAG: TIGR04086 family membrane protein [Acidimicrobiales bacterium]|nr:TIGR04086 family membrane protein [Acidimicrobiales bacterium]MCB1013969.1 TIGR04086 family membrane protein [Acidimicrobiales bacterium]
MSRLDGRAVLLGGVVALAIAVPPAVLAQVQSDRDALEGSNWVLVLFAVVLLAFVVGGYVAADRADGDPLAHGAVAAVAAFVVVQGYGVLRRLADGDEIRWLGMLFALLLAGSCGTVGAILASVRGRRSS